MASIDVSSLNVGIPKERTLDKNIELWMALKEAIVSESILNRPIIMTLQELTKVLKKSMLFLADFSLTLRFVMQDCCNQVSTTHGV
jgi:hypothetical protein